MGKRLGILLENRRIVRGDLWVLWSPFFVKNDLSHQGGSDFPKVSELDGSTSGTRNPTQRSCSHSVLLPLMMSVA